MTLCIELFVAKGSAYVLYIHDLVFQKIKIYFPACAVIAYLQKRSYIGIINLKTLI